MGNRFIQKRNQRLNKNPPVFSPKTLDFLLCLHVPAYLHSQEHIDVFYFTTFFCYFFYSENICKIHKHSSLSLFDGQIACFVFSPHKLKQNCFKDSCLNAHFIHGSVETSSYIQCHKERMSFCGLYTLGYHLIFSDSASSDIHRGL